MKTNTSWKRLMIVVVLGVALTGVSAYSSTSEIIAVGTIPHSELFDGPATVTVRKLTIDPGEILTWHYHPGRAYNVCSGIPRSVGEMASALGRAIPGSPEPVVTGEWRAGDVRHVFASAERAARELGFVAQEDFDAGMREFATAELRA